MTIGEKIKNRRKQLGLTQSKVAGEKISRNMLSLIESENATPSLETLYYLAEKLNVRPEYLISEDIPFEVFERIDHEQEILDAYRNEKYEDVLYLVDSFGQNSELIMYLGAECAYQLAKQKVRGGSLASARKWIDKTNEYISSTFLDGRLIQAKIMLISSICQNIQSPKLNFEQALYEQIISDAIDDEFYHYYIGDIDYVYQNPILALHTNAKKLIKTRKYSDAIALLLQAEELKSQDNYDAYVFFGIITDLENCYKELFDFEKAYRYATKKISMMEYFKS